MSRVAFITDQHFDSESRWEETLRIARWCTAELAELRPDAIALGGDIFERRPNSIEVRAVAEWIIALAEIAPVVGVYGNHDVAESLAVMNKLETLHPVHIAHHPCLYVAGGVEFSLLPWPRKERLLAAIGDLSMEASRQVGSEALLNVLRGLGAKDRTERRRCFVGHVQLRGARVSTGQPLAPGADFELGMQDLGLAQADAYLLGHIHMPDDMLVDGKPCCYGGSFRRTAYGEVEEKSIVLVDLDSGEMQRIPTPCSGMLLFSDEWGLDASGAPGWLVGITEYSGPETLRGAEIRFRWQVEADRRGAARAAADALRAEWLAAGAIDVKFEERVNTTTRARAPEIAAAATLPQKLSAYWRARNTTPEPERAARLIEMATSLDS